MNRPGDELPGGGSAGSSCDASMPAESGRTTPPQAAQGTSDEAGEPQVQQGNVPPASAKSKGGRSLGGATAPTVPLFLSPPVDSGRERSEAEESTGPLASSPARTASTSGAESGDSDQEAGNHAPDPSPQAQSIGEELDTVSSNEGAHDRGRSAQSSEPAESSGRAVLATSGTSHGDRSDRPSPATAGREMAASLVQSYVDARRVAQGAGLPPSPPQTEASARSSPAVSARGSPAAGREDGAKESGDMEEKEGESEGEGVPAKAEVDTDTEAVLGSGSGSGAQSLSP